MEDFQKRLFQEEKELNEKISKLYDFIQGENFDKVSNMQKPLLEIQLQAMRTYHRCLAKRIQDCWV